MQFDRLNMTPKHIVRIQEATRMTYELEVEVQFQPEIFIDLEFDLTEDEYNQQVNAFLNLRSARIQQEVKLHFAERKSCREIESIVKISKSQVHKDIVAYRNEFLKSIKQDISFNKSALGLLVELTAQVENRIRLLVGKYDDLEISLQVLGVPIERAYNRLKKNPNVQIGNANRLKEIAREKRAIIESQRNILSQLKGETQQLLNIYDSFGLTSPEAINLVNTGETYLQEKIKEIEQTVVSLIEIVKLEVSDLEARKRIFGRLANDVKIRALAKYKQGLEGGYNENSEFRI